MRKLSTALLAGALLTLAIPASAQSLGELAKKEAERRKAAAPASKTYTNADLKQVPTPSGTAKEGSEAIKADAKADDAAKPSDKAEPEKVDSTKPPEPAKDEAYWKGRITSAREDVLAEMARLTQDIDKGNKLSAEIEEEARRAGVPPGWIR